MSIATDHLERLGATPEQIASFADAERRGLIAGRIVGQLGPDHLVDIGDAIVRARASGAIRHEASASEDLPAVGDFVGIVPGTGGGEGRIALVVQRTSLLRRRSADSESQAQTVAANVDVVLCVAALEHGFSIRRIERMVAIAHEAPARAFVVLAKSDLCADVASKLSEVTTSMPRVDVVTIGTGKDAGLPELTEALPRGKTAVLIGMSGAGKSTLTNRLLGSNRMAVAEVRSSDARGKHTTTHRELAHTPWGAFIIDGPGVRELGVVDDEGLESTFDDVAEIAARCRFSDCGHASEPGCAVRDALAAGSLRSDRYEAFKKLTQEAAFLRAQEDPAVRRARKAKEKALTSAAWQASRNKKR